MGGRSKIERENMAAPSGFSMALCEQRSVARPALDLTIGRQAATPTHWRLLPSPAQQPSAVMGGCQSRCGCHAPSRELEYYDAWRHQVPCAAAAIQFALR